MTAPEHDIADTIRAAGTDAVLAITDVAKRLSDQRDDIRAPVLAAQTEEERIAAMEQAAARVWNNGEAAHFWLRCPHPALHRRAPIDVARTRQGAERVLDVLDGILFGPTIKAAD